MKRKTVFLAFALLTATMLLTSGCQTKEDTADSSETVEVVETTDHTETIPPEETPEITVTPESTQTTEPQAAIEMPATVTFKYEECEVLPLDLENNLLECPGGTYQITGKLTVDEYDYYIIGVPNDKSWRKMTDEEAQEYIDNYDETLFNLPSEEWEAYQEQYHDDYEAASRELSFDYHIFSTFADGDRTYVTWNYDTYTDMLARDEHIRKEISELDADVFEQYCTFAEDAFEKDPNADLSAFGEMLANAQTAEGAETRIQLYHELTAAMESYRKEYLE